MMKNIIERCGMQSARKYNPENVAQAMDRLRNIHGNWTDREIGDREAFTQISDVILRLERDEENNLRHRK